MSQNETEQLLAMLDSMEEAISNNAWPSNDPAGSAEITGEQPASPWGDAPSPANDPAAWPGARTGEEAPSWGGTEAAADPTPGAAVPRPDAAPITAARRVFPDAQPVREGYTPTRGATAEVLAAIPWVPES